MRKFALIAAVVLASASAQAQAGESRSLTGLTVNDAPSATNPQPRANDALRAENTTPSTQAPAPADTPRYSVPSTEAPQPVEPARDTTDTPRYSPRLAPVSTTPSTAATQPPPSDTTERPTRTRHARAERPHYRGGVTAGQIIAALHRYGIYW
jgi:hypothetical protein